MTPEHVLQPLIARVKLPEIAISVIYELLLWEIKNGYPGTPDAPDDAHRAVAYINTLEQLFTGVQEEGVGAFDTSLRYFTQSITFVTQHPSGNNSFGHSNSQSMWSNLLRIPVSHSLPEQLRYRHCTVLGITGSGKTSLLERLIWADIQTDATVVVMTLKGHLIPTLSRLKAIPPERLIHFHPGNVIPLNPFALEQSVSSTELITRLFADTEPTPKQDTLLKYCIQLLFKSKGTLKDLRTLMTSPLLPSKYREHLHELTEEGADFFREQFGSKGDAGYSKTKEQMLWRLDSIFASPLVTQIFGQQENGIDMSRVFESGNVVLIDASESDFGTGGSIFLGRYFIALATLAAIRRKKPTRPVYIYIDEAANFLTANAEMILNRAREAQVGLTLALLKLEDLKTLESTVLAQTRTKIVGTCSTEDARKLTSAMQIEKHTQLEHQTQFSFTMKAGDASPKNVWAMPGFLNRFEKRDSPTAHHHVQAAPPRVAESTPQDATKPRLDW